MPRLRVLQLLMIAGTIGMIGALPAAFPVLADDMAAPPVAPPAAMQPMPQAPDQANPQWQSNNQWQPGATDSDQAVQPVHAGNVTYVTGGIGDEERSALNSMKSSYNLHITSASKSGEFAGNTHIIVRDRQGNPVVNASAGPDLPRQATGRQLHARSHPRQRKPYAARDRRRPQTRRTPSELAITPGDIAFSPPSEAPP